MYIYLFTHSIYLCILCKHEERNQKRCIILGAVVSEWQYAVAQVVEELRYNPKSRGFDSRWGRLNL